MYFCVSWMFDSWIHKRFVSNVQLCLIFHNREKWKILFVIGMKNLITGDIWFRSNTFSGKALKLLKFVFHNYANLFCIFFIYRKYKISSLALNLNHLKKTIAVFNFNFSNAITILKMSVRIILFVYKIKMVESWNFDKC